MPIERREISGAVVVQTLVANISNSSAFFATTDAILEALKQRELLKALSKRIK